VREATGHVQRGWSARIVADLSPCGACPAVGGVTAWRGTHRESAWGQESQKAAALDAGADDYVTKPRPSTS